MDVWAVVYSNYWPAEVDSIWETEELAEARAASLDGPWEVTSFIVRNALPQKAASDAR